MNAASRCLGAVALVTTLLAGCAAPQKTSTQPIAIDAQAWTHARFVEFAYVDDHLSSVDYLDALPRPESTPRRMACLQRKPLPPATRGISAWVWRSRELIGSTTQGQTAFLQKAKQNGIATLILQAQPDLTQFDAFLTQADAAGIRVALVAGEPDNVLDGRPLLRLIDAIEGYNATHRIKFTGVQFDVEPYLLKEYRENEPEVLTRYVELLKSLRAATAGRLELGVAVPFWFADKTLRDESFMSLVTAQVDRLSIMSYRTDLPALLDIANNALCYGELYGKPVDLGLEVTKLPRETHYVVPTSQLASSIRVENGKTVLLRERGELEHLAVNRSAVEPSRLSFYPDIEAAFAMTRLPVPYLSFAGWSINGLDDVWLAK